MHCRGLVDAIVVAALTIPVGAQAADDARYPDWKGAWARFVVRGLGGQPSFDQTKPWGFGQEAPLTEEYKKVLEASLADHALGRFMNHNLAEYHVPVNADVRDIEVIFVEEPDAIINPLGIKGVGEIGIVGVAAAITNAIYHATGKRVRDLPITLDKILG